VLINQATVASTENKTKAAKELNNEPGGQQLASGIRGLSGGRKWLKVAGWKERTKQSRACILGHFKCIANLAVWRGQGRL